MEAETAADQLLAELVIPVTDIERERNRGNGIPRRYSSCR